jgi:hypothetical protein
MNEGLLGSFGRAPPSAFLGRSSELALRAQLAGGERLKVLAIV